MKNATYKGWYLYFKNRQWYVSRGDRDIGPFLLRDRAKEWVDEHARASNPRKTHTAKFDRCVKSIRRRLKGISNPHAVCMAALGKKALRKR